jgi:hypothetical protein
MNVLNHTRYDLQSCNNFNNPSHLLENYHFGLPDEFLPQDSDLIVMSQVDAVLCHELHMDKWRDVSWVGAPWPARKEKMDGIFVLCHQIEEILSNLVRRANGGCRLRSRSWLRKAIEYCLVVDKVISGLSQDAYDAPCKATTVAAEDI